MIAAVGEGAAADAVRDAVRLHAAGRTDQAIAACERALVCDPRCGAAFGAMAWLLARAGRGAELAGHYARWFAALPDDPTAAHMHAATAGHGLSRASSGYVTELFDEFAASFDATLDVLGYDAPREVATDVLDAVAGRAGLCGLDAGCGTGLLGERLRPAFSTLVGVDLSAAMLSRAQGRGCYDALVCGDLIEHLRAHAGAYDAIAAADVLVYLGDLAQVATAVAAALRPGGVVVVTTEVHDGTAPFVLGSTGRFTHRPDAAAAAFTTAGLLDAAFRPIVLRREGGVPVRGISTRARREDR